MPDIRRPPVNPGRLLSAFGHIGYNPVSALLDIGDNSVSAQATSIAIKVDTENQQGAAGRPKAVLKAFTIVDNGTGMDEAGIDNALSLGSSPQAYHEYTLSKFGLGLKSAAASLGRCLEIITRPKADPSKAFKAVLDCSKITSDYFYELVAPSDEDIALLESVASKGSGTVIRITEPLLDSLPRASEIIEELKQRAGVIYHYYLQGQVPHAEKLAITVNGDEVKPFDPLFTSEIADGDAGDLNENTWAGLQPNFIQREQSIQLDKKGAISAVVTITQLPHPPSVGRVGTMTQAACRDRYMIGAGNYGFYIYRNHRLISWAASLGYVPQDQDLYAFRGRFLINSQADDLLNIDVTKSRIHLSETAEDQLKPLIGEAVKKSRAAWKNATANVQKILSRTPHDEANEELDKISKLEDKSDELDESVAPPAEREKLKTRRTKAVGEKPTTPEESTKLREQKQRVQWVDSLDNNQLWERAHDPEAGLIVRVNSSHRFARDMIAAVHGDANLLKVIDVLFYALARGEYGTVYKSDSDPKVIEKVMAEFRERVGGALSDLTRQLDISEFLGGK
ncbi:ATP-binding protein [Gemmata sp. G18]|uniref:ATP-binding protein n=1 Tax=Gemmata palustris TaxID=2822762 RepID=A0ABS5BNQ5_9BACT|nr:ATP-binding protein [Gemmata palustris]MBP3955359.1 ATP-binding protein [Gemmata palustris]